MLIRKIDAELLKWKNKKKRKCLVVNGARQVGKTYSIEQFGLNNYKHYIYINFIEKPELCSIFDGNIDADTIIKQLKYKFGKTNFEAGKTLIFLDEIQQCPNARAALKFLTIDGKFDFIASGSLLGINYKEVSSFPVGYVEHLQMKSLDFEEFLWALGVDKDTIKLLYDCYHETKPVPEFIHNDMLQKFRQYIAIGGMPEVVNNFIENSDYHEVLKIQRNILDDYSNDIAKYAEGNEKSKAKACFLSVPKHLAKDYKKFQYSLVEARGSSRKYAGSLNWLFDAGIINFCHNLSIPELPLEGNSREDAFKVYMCDTGLLIAMLEDGSQQDILKGNLGIYKGAIYENIIADIFAKTGKKLYYFEYNSQLELDFIIRYNGRTAAIEVKSADNTKSKSLTSALTNWKVDLGIRLSTKNLGQTNKILSLPLYMAMFLNN